MTIRPLMKPNIYYILENAIVQYIYIFSFHRGTIFTHLVPFSLYTVIAGRSVFGNLSKSIEFFCSDDAFRPERLFFFYVRTLFCVFFERHFLSSGGAFCPEVLSNHRCQQVLLLLRLWHAVFGRVTWFIACVSAFDVN